MQSPSAKLSRATSAQIALNDGFGFDVLGKFWRPHNRDDTQLGIEAPCHLEKSCGTVPTMISDIAVAIRNQIDSKVAISAKPSHSVARA
jgi:hypothetical protein